MERLRRARPSNPSHGGGPHPSKSHTASGSHPDAASPSKVGHTGGHHESTHSSTKREPAQRAKFMRSHPCPSTGRTQGACPAYVVDHKVALKRGGRDDPSNMQWQRTEGAKAKDRWE